jgi:bifunctional DNase/RNase
MIRLGLVSVGLVEDSASVVVVLRAESLERLLVMEVGLLEGRAIAMEAEGVRAPRPLTHELLLAIIERLGASVQEVQIRDFQDQTFFATLILKQADGSLVELDARPSDALSLALRAGAPIVAAEAVIEKAGIDEDEAESDEDEPDALDDEDDDDEDEDEEEPIVH